MCCVDLTRFHGKDALQEGFEHVRLDVTLLTMHNAVPREYPLQPGLNEGIDGSPHINGVSIEHREHNRWYDKTSPFFF